MTVFRHILVGASLVAVAASPALAQPVANEFFESRIRPILAAKCYACHNSTMKEPKGYLTLDSREGVMKGGTLGPALVPGKPADSKLIHAMKYVDPHLQMPPSGKLADEVIADFEAWIAGGAPDPRVSTAAAAVAKRRIVDDAELQKGRQWWAFQGVNVLPQPVSAHAATARTKLDHFVYARMAEKGLTPSQQADDRTLIRRAYIDLIGLKPTYDEVEAYASDASPNKYEKLVDTLLAVPQYGERWGRHWLDVVRYGEDNPGNIPNPPYPHAWRYRDWVIEALNKDVPYDRFVTLQLAADLMPGTSRPDMRALGPIALGPQDHKDVRLSIDVIGTLQLNDWDERLDTMTRGLLGLSCSARAATITSSTRSGSWITRGLRACSLESSALRPVCRDRSEKEPIHGVYPSIRPAYRPTLLESDPGSKPEKATACEKFVRSSTRSGEIDAMSRRTSRPAYIKTVRIQQRDAEDSIRTHAQKSGAGARREARAPADRFESERVQNKGRRRPAQKIGRSASSIRLRRGVGWTTSESISRSRRHPGKPRLCGVSGRESRTPTDSCRAGSRWCSRRTAADFKNGSGRPSVATNLTGAAPLSARGWESRVGGISDKPSSGTPSEFGIQGCTTHRAARGSLRAVHCERMVAQVAAPRDHAVGDLSAVEQAAHARDGHRSDEPADVAHESAPHGHRGVPRFAAAGLGQAGSHAVRTVAAGRRRGRSPHDVFVDQPWPQQRCDAALRRAGAAGAHSDAAADVEPAAGAVRHE